MRRLLKAILAAIGLAAAVSAAAQAEREEAGEMSGEQIEQFAGMMAGVFQTEPLTAEQAARLPAAESVVGQMMPDGFYGEMMGGMVDKMMRPMMAMVAQPSFILGTRLEMDQDTIDALGEAEQVELAQMLDPAYDLRVEAIIGVMTDKMGGMFSAMEGPMRDGLSRAYAVRFDEAQLADIDGFFQTPTGSLYARESMALFGDPQVMQATMKALPAMMSGFGNFEGAIVEAMSALPAERAYEDLSPAQRERLAEVLGVEPSGLAKIVKPPKPLDRSANDEAL